MNVDKLLAFGDSVVWGQGLDHRDKFPSVVYQRLTGRTLPTDDIKARSGAIIGRRNLAAVARESPPLGADVVPERTARHEVPNAFPTVLQQIDGGSPKRSSEPGESTVERITASEAAAADVVVVDGGANDINVLFGVLSPIDPDDVLGGLTDHADIERYLRQYCYEDVRDVLRAARDRFPNAVIVVTGYFPILTEKSGVGPENVLELLKLLAGVVVVGPSALLLANGMKSRSMYFYRRQLYWLRRAVTESNSDPAVRGPGILFAHGRFRAVNGLWASESWLHDTSVRDRMADVRGRACEAVYPIVDADGSPEPLEAYADLKKRPGCRAASTAHPNEAGAKAYADDILARLADHDAPSLREPMSRLSGTGAASFRNGLERYGLDPSEGIRSALDQTVVDVIQVRVSTGDDPTDDVVSLRVGPGVEFRLNGKRATHGVEFAEFGEGTVGNYTVDPTYDGNRSRPLRLWEIDRLELVKPGGDTWSLAEVEVQLNGRTVVHDRTPTPPSGGAIWKGQFPVASAS